MLQTMTTRQARDNFADLLGAVYYGKQTIKITKKNKVVAIVVNPQEYASMKRSAEKRIKNMLGQKPLTKQLKNENQLLTDSIKAVDEIRAEIHDNYIDDKKKA